MVRRILTLVAILLTTVLYTTAQTGQFIPANRLSSSLIADLCQDRQGSIWIATDYGLNRFDGYHVQTFLHSESDSTTIGVNAVVSLLCDSDGNLWVGTNQGLDRFDPNTESFVHYRFPDGRRPRVSSLLQLSDGSVLIGRMVGNETKSYRVFRTLAEQPTPPNEQLKGWVDGLVQSALGALLGETRSEPFQWMVGAANGLRGKLLQTDGTRYEGTTRDSAGNIVPEKVSEQTGSVDSILWGSISVTKRRTQIGTHVRKQSLATFPMPFEGNYLGISFTVGQSSD